MSVLINTNRELFELISDHSKEPTFIRGAKNSVEMLSSQVAKEKLLNTLQTPITITKQQFWEKLKSKSRNINPEIFAAAYSNNFYTLSIRLLLKITNIVRKVGLITKLPLAGGLFDFWFKFTSFLLLPIRSVVKTSKVFEIYRKFIEFEKNRQELKIIVNINKFTERQIDELRLEITQNRKVISQLCNKQVLDLTRKFVANIVWIGSFTPLKILLDITALVSNLPGSVETIDLLFNLINYKINRSKNSGFEKYKIRALTEDEGFSFVQLKAIKEAIGDSYKNLKPAILKDYEEEINNVNRGLNGEDLKTILVARDILLHPSIDEDAYDNIKKNAAVQQELIDSLAHLAKSKIELESKFVNFEQRKTLVYAVHSFMIAAATFAVLFVLPQFAIFVVPAALITAVIALSSALHISLYIFSFFLSRKLTPHGHGYLSLTKYRLLFKNLKLDIDDFFLKLKLSSLCDAKSSARRSLLTEFDDLKNRKLELDSSYLNPNLLNTLKYASISEDQLKELFEKLKNSEGVVHFAKELNALLEYVYGIPTNDILKYQNNKQDCDPNELAILQRDITKFLQLSSDQLVSFGALLERLYYNAT